MLEVKKFNVAEPEILLPRMKYSHEIVSTHGGALLPEQNPSCVSALTG